MAFEDFVAFYESQGYIGEDAILFATLAFIAERGEDACVF